MENKMSDKNLGQLIATLKNEAIDVAEKEARKIVEEARLQAQQTLEAAEKKRDAMMANAEREARDIVAKGEKALRLAGRDYSISVRNELLNIFHTVLEAETRKAFTPDLMKTAILKVIENIGSEVELRLAPDFSKELAEHIHDRLQSSDKTVSMIKDNSVLSGFSVAQKDQGWHYDITPEEVAAALHQHLTGNWMDIFKSETKK